MADNDKLFLVVRRDLPVPQQAVQAAHALQELNMNYPESAGSWHRVSNHLALLDVPDERALADLLRKAARQGVPVCGFREPDRGDELTAIALAPCPAAKRLCRGLPLALSAFPPVYEGL